MNGYKLKIGKMDNQEIASWFGISKNTLKNRRPKYLEILEDYCDFEKVYGGVNITEIHIEEYDKTYKPKIEKLYLEEIEYCVENQDGLSSVSGMARKFLVEEKLDVSQRTAERLLGKSGEKLFGKTKEENSYGAVGCRNYVWAIKVDDWNGYRFMTEEEWDLFTKIVEGYYSSNSDKVIKAALLEDRLRKKEIDTDEYFLRKDSMGLDLFSECLLMFREQTGHIVVRCSQHEIGVPFEAKEKTQAAVDAIKECKPGDFEF